MNYGGGGDYVKLHREYLKDIKCLQRPTGACTTHTNSNGLDRIHVNKLRLTSETGQADSQ